MTRWLVVATLRRGELHPPEELDAAGCALADSAFAAEKKTPASVCQAMAAELEREQHPWEPEVCGLRARELERERARNGWWSA